MMRISKETANVGEKVPMWGGSSLPQYQMLQEAFQTSLYHLQTYGNLLKRYPCSPRDLRVGSRVEVFRKTAVREDRGEVVEGRVQLSECGLTSRLYFTLTFVHSSLSMTALEESA